MPPLKLSNFAIDTWYSAPYPEEYANEQVLYNCEFCLKYMRNAYTMHRHKIKCGYKRPPGDEIYRDGKISVFEVDGRKNRIYCQNLCLMAKMFLDHKTLYYDVEPFLFYVLTEVDEDGCHLAGYFSKEKSFERKYNLSCILTLPHHQRKGFGTFLIDLSYLLSKKEKRLGTPEKPLSDLGLLSYKAYWKLKIYLYLESILNRFSQVSIMDICEKTSMESMDVKDTLLECKILIKSDENNYELHINQHEIINYLAKIRQKGLLLAIPEKLRWSPYLVKNFDNTTNQNDDELLIKF
ncbi:hypothetical protein K502DRAFT_334507 [Neoconidiobolus thromboides FSU 785]|nr:hypothetical protein K502DRAFT_334507 [Neoconidiobolus thromboides FSU 785]